MLKAIRDFFEGHLSATQVAQDESRAIQIATAALLVEMLRMDSEFEPAEREAVLGAVRSKFGLSAEEANHLFALAEAESRQATDYFQFTSLLNQHFDAEQKAKVIEHMWQVAYADAELSAWEQHLVRKIAALLHVPDSTYIAAKMRAKPNG
jgi:uncharacterized tellurite resistance protein B-like protein